jgi:integrase
MQDEIRVHVIDYGKHRNLVARYTDPKTGKHVTRSTGTRRRKQSERFAAKWEADLQEGRYKAPSKVLWHEFRQRYEDEVFPTIADATGQKISGVFNAVEEFLNPTRLASLTTDRINHFQRLLREKRGCEGETIKGYMAHLMATLRWAVRVGLLNEVPVAEKLKRARARTLAKGRPITAEEFERILTKIPQSVGTERAPLWDHYLRGLWWSGLRLLESIDLTWDDDRKLRIVETEKYLMLSIPRDLEKGNRDRLMPIAPEFSEFLLATPEDERTGYVFNPAGLYPDRGRLRKGNIGRTISRFGREAGVKVWESGKGKVKHASAHDFRRSFGERWAMRVMPQVLMELMRHENINTTLKYYATRNAQTTSAVLWEAISGNNSGNTLLETPVSPVEK